MAYQVLDTLTFDNCTIECRYADDYSLTAVQTVPLGPVIPEGTPARGWQPGQSMLGPFRRGDDRVRVLATDYDPYGAESVEPDYYVGLVCNLDFTHSFTGTTLTIVVTTSHGPWQARIDTENNYTAGKTSWPGLTPGATVRVWVRDEADCEQYDDVQVPGGGGAHPGVKIDEFTDAQGVLHEQYYDASQPVGGQLTDYTTPPTPALANPVSEAERGWAQGAAITGLCELPNTRVSFTASLDLPYVLVSRTPNSEQCGYAVLAGSATGLAPAPAGGAGTVRVVVTAGVFPVTATVEETGDTYTFPAAGQHDFAAAPGSYHVELVDSAATAQVLNLTALVPAAAVWGCTDPNATNPTPGATADDGSCVYTPPAFVPVFRVPLLNPLRFVVPADLDNCAVFETPDNTLFCQQTRPGQQVRPRYVQKVARCDAATVQVLTTYTEVLATVRDAAGQPVATVAAQRVQQLTGMAAPVAVALADNGDGWTRLTVAAGADNNLPENLLRTQRVVLAGATAGTYRVRLRGTDVATGAGYLVLHRPWQGPVAGGVTVSWPLLGPGYNVWQVVLDWQALPDGEYQVELTATAAGQPAAVAVSEPLRLADAHPNTVLLQYRNADNAFGLVWSTGIRPRLRVDGVFFRRPPMGGTLAVHRSSSDEPAVLSATARRLILLETVDLPDWLHEQLFLVCRLDELEVNGRRFSTDAPYEWEEQGRHPLLNGKVALEQVDWLGAGNGDDAGAFVPDGDALPVLRRSGFMKLRKG